MRVHDLFEAELAEHARVVEESLTSLEEQFVAMFEAWSRTIRRGGKIMFLGNGGSAADAQHFAAELVVRYSKNRPPLPALALTTDTSNLTAAGNDLGYETVFSRQIEALGKPEDLVVGISTSGRSTNVVMALQMAKQMGLEAAAFTGCDGGLLVQLATPIIIVPSVITARIQEMHVTLGHMLCKALDSDFARNGENQE